MTLRPDGAIYLEDQQIGAEYRERFSGRIESCYRGFEALHKNSAFCEAENFRLFGKDEECIYRYQDPMISQDRVRLMQNLQGTALKRPFMTYRTINQKDNVGFIYLLKV